MHPAGHELLTSFRLRPFPTFVWSVDGVDLEKRVFMPNGENTVVVEWELRGRAANCRLEVRPLVAFRDYHSTAQASGSFNGAVEHAPGLAAIQPYSGLPRLYFAHNAVGADAGPGWYHNVEFPIECERGLDHAEDLYCPLVLTFDAASTATVIASTEPRDVDQAAVMRAAEEARRALIVSRAPFADPFVQELALAPTSTSPHAAT